MLHAFGKINTLYTYKLHLENADYISFNSILAKKLQM